jgi:hypothetical protein
MRGAIGLGVGFQHPKIPGVLARAVLGSLQVLMRDILRDAAVDWPYL